MIPRLLLWLAKGPLAPGAKGYDWIIARGERVKRAQFRIVLVLFPLFCLASWIRLLLKKVTFRKPSILWAPTPILTLPESSAVLNKAGYRSETLVFTTYFITERFDHNMRPVLDNPAVNQWFTGYLFLWSLLRFDIYHFFYDGGLWSGMKIVPWARWIELPLLRIAGKRIVATAYGADVRSRGRNEMWQPWNICRECPEPGRSCICDDRAALRSARYHRDWCNGLLAMGDMYDFVYGSDQTLVYWPIDVKAVPYVGIETKADGAEIIVAHSPNHRYFKGTRFIERAVAGLKEEGLNVRLDLIERVSNVEAKRRYGEADIVFAQCLAGWTGYTEIEAMAAGKPVLTYMRDEAVYLPHLPTWAAISVTPDTVQDALRRLVLDGAERQRLGEAGRRHVEEAWSHEALAAPYVALHKRIWRKGGLIKSLASKRRDLREGDLRTRVGEPFKPSNPGEFRVWTDPSEEMRRLTWGIWGRPAFDAKGRPLVHGPDGARPHAAADALYAMTAFHARLLQPAGEAAKAGFTAAAHGLLDQMRVDANGVARLDDPRDAYISALPEMPRRAAALRGLALPVCLRAWLSLGDQRFEQASHDLAFSLCQTREAGGAFVSLPGGMGTFLDHHGARNLFALSGEVQCALALIEYDAAVDKDFVMPRVQLCAATLHAALRDSTMDQLIETADLGADFRMDDLFFVAAGAQSIGHRTRRPELVEAGKALLRRFRKHRLASFRAYSTNL